MFYEARAGRVSYYRFSELESVAGFFHAFTSRATDSKAIDARAPGEVAQERPHLLESLRLRPELVVTLRQVHSAAVLSCREAAGSTLATAERREGDGILLEEEGRWGAIRTADCVPILLVAPRRRQVCLLHAGWRGTCDRIARAGALRLMDSSGAAPGEIVAAFGPAIRSCCYEVGSDVRERFEAAAHDPKRVFRSRNLDLIQANAAVLEDLGIAPPLDSGVCTACGSDRFYSWRKNRDTGRSWTIAGFDGAATGTPSAATPSEPGT